MAVNNAHDKYVRIFGHRQYYGSLGPALQFFLHIISTVSADLGEECPVIFLVSPTLVP